jgi:succinate dehydrogenase / fumarate reductase flavoprotein subunit
VQYDLQETMQNLVGIVRREDEIFKALDALEQLKARAARVGVTGRSEFNPGWHTALDLRNLLTVSEAIARAALDRKESRGAQFRDDYPNKDAELGKTSVLIRKATDGSMRVERERLPDLPPHLQQVIEEMK